MVPEWRESYMSYNKLKDMLEIIISQMVTKAPAEWNIGVSLTTHAPTNAAAMPSTLMPDAVRIRFVFPSTLVHHGEFFFLDLAGPVQIYKRWKWARAHHSE
jgi:hypothetical protein